MKIEKHEHNKNKTKNLPYHQKWSLNIVVYTFRVQRNGVILYILYLTWQAIIFYIYPDHINVCIMFWEYAGEVVSVTIGDMKSTEGDKAGRI